MELPFDDLPPAAKPPVSARDRDKALLHDMRAMQWPERAPHDALHIYTDGACSGNPRGHRGLARIPRPRRGHCHRFGQHLRGELLSPALVGGMVVPWVEKLPAPARRQPGTVGRPLRPTGSPGQRKHRVSVGQGPLGKSNERSCGHFGSASDGGIASPAWTFQVQVQSLRVELRESVRHRPAFSPSVAQR